MRLCCKFWSVSAVRRVALAWGGPSTARGSHGKAGIPWHEKTCCIPPTADAAFVARIEDVLEVYQLPYDPQRPVVCMDELCQQLIAGTRIAWPVREGRPA
jgi:hypothetical protein